MVCLHPPILILKGVTTPQLGTKIHTNPRQGMPTTATNFHVMQPMSSDKCHCLVLSLVMIPYHWISKPLKLKSLWINVHSWIGRYHESQI